MAYDSETSWDTSSSFDADLPEIQSIAVSDTRRSVPPDVFRHGDKLCTFCAPLDLRRERFIVFKGDPDSKTLSRASDPLITLGPVEKMREHTSCPLCRLVIATLGGNRLPTHDDGQQVRVTVSWKSDGPRSPEQPWVYKPSIRYLSLLVRKKDDSFLDGDTMFFPEIRLLVNDIPDRAPAAARNELVRLIQPNAIDFDIVRRWIHLCNTHHGGECRKNPLLKILHRSHPIEVVSNFRCVDIHDGCVVPLPPGQPYAALSYVWGQQEFYTAKGDHVNELAQPGAIAKLGDKLAPTMRDAIHVAREIGIRYLWIDCLCIVQDDKEIMNDSIAKMDLIYCAADLVIVAAGSLNAYSGIAGIRPGTRNFRQPVERFGDAGPDVFHLAANSRWQDSIKDASYYTRGWTLQETRFATRSLNFIGGSVVFHCQVVDSWQEHTQEKPDEIRGQARYEMSDRNDIGTMEQFINDFSKREVSYSTDAYNAFAGISRQLKIEYNTNICHGIPTRFFDWHLLWDPAPKARPTRHTDCGPSWSWSGWTGGVWAHIWDWYTRDIETLRHGIRHHTWIVWYQRKAHTSIEYEPIVRHHKRVDNGHSNDGSNGDPLHPDARETHHHPSSDTAHGTRNLYGARAKTERRFPGLDCSCTTPSAMVLVSPNDSTDDFPRTLVVDTLGNWRGSGFLQFWTVSLILRIDEPTSVDDREGPVDYRCRLGLFGRSGDEIGNIRLQPDWLKQQLEQPGTVATSTGLPMEREFIVLCEGHDGRPPGNGDPEAHKEGWVFRVMLIEWVTAKGKRLATGAIRGACGTASSKAADAGTAAEIAATDDNNDGAMYAERVAIGTLKLGSLGEALGNGAVWKEIILG